MPVPAVVLAIEYDAKPPIVIPAFVTPEAFAAEVNKREQNDADLLAATQAADAKATQAKSAAETAQSTATNAQTTATGAVQSILTNGISDDLQKALVTSIEQGLNAEDAAIKGRLNNLEVKDAELETAVNDRLRIVDHNAAQTITNLNFSKVMGEPTPK